DFDFEEIRDKPEILLGVFRKLDAIANAVGGLAPAGQRFVFRSDPLVFLSQRGHFVNRRAFVFVAGTDLDVPLSIENVELGDYQRVSTVDHFGVTKDGEVEPAATAGASSDGAEFFAARANFPRFEIGHLGRKWSSADASGVSLSDPQHVLDFGGRHADAGGSAARCCRRGSD